MTLCHCDTCTTATGQLCTTGVEIPPGSKPPLITGKVKGYKPAGATIERFFCETCGARVYADASGIKPGLMFLCTGAFETGSVFVEGRSVAVYELKQHVFVASTKDGGLRDWCVNVPAWEGWGTQTKEIPTDTLYGTASNSQASQEPISQFVSSKDELHCSCHCGGVAFSITRPRDGSKHWPVPSESEILSSPVSLPKSPEWFMPAAGAKYNAFLCACNDCRFSSGHDVSAWAMIPKKNFRAANRDDVSPENVGGLQRESTMRDYGSSEGVHRQFCGGCGATLSFFNEVSPNLMNVAVGLMRSASGRRVEDWLVWQTGEVGYAGLAMNPGFINGLEGGMKEWAVKTGMGMGVERTF